MKTAEFNENYEINRKSKGVKATAKNSRPYAEPLPVITADGTAYDPTATYYFFDVSTQEIRQSTGLRRDGDFLSTFGLRVVAVSKLHADRSDALADGQKFFRQQIENLNKRIADYELEKSGEIAV